MAIGELESFLDNDEELSAAPNVRRGWELFHPDRVSGTGVARHGQGDNQRRKTTEDKNIIPRTCNVVIAWTNLRLRKMTLCGLSSRLVILDTLVLVGPIISSIHYLSV